MIINVIHPSDREAVLEAHQRLPGQKMETTVHNALFHGVARRAVSAQPDRRCAVCGRIRCDGDALAPE